MLGGKNRLKSFPVSVFVAEAFNVFTGPTSGAGNGPDPLESALNRQHRINTILPSAFGANSLWAEDQPGDHVTGNNLVGTGPGAFEHPSVNELCNYLVEFKFPAYRASGAYGAKRHKGNLLYWATVHSRIALWREIQNDFYAGRKDDSRTPRTVR